MEDGLNEAPLTDATRNGLIPSVMANFPEGTVQANDKTEPVELNGSLHSSDDEADEDSETNALIIDETVPKRRIKKRKRKNKKIELEKDLEPPVLHSNPYFNESLFELSQQHQKVKDSPQKKPIKLSKKPKPKPKLQEYAQYLGLQPAVQFKCSKCHRAGFETLTSLNEHFSICTGNPNLTNEVTENSSSSFKLTRKVFLCSACGTYYENWNLYLHMLEFHRRFICLYCLGMFSALDDLCQHIQSRHNCEPQHRETPEEFFKEYKDPCYLICCECKKLFNEQDNFFYHKCIKCDVPTTTPTTSNTKNNNKKCAKTQILPENHVTGDFTTDESTMVRSDSPVATPEIQAPEAPHFEPVEKIDSNEMTCEKVDDVVETMETGQKQTTDFPSQETIGSVIEDSNEIVNSPEATIPEQLSEDEQQQNEEEEQEEEEEPRTASDVENEEISAEFKDLNGGEELETRKVPKLSLKLPKYDAYSHEDSDDSTKLGMDVDQVESESECMNISDEKQMEPQIRVAGTDVSITELELEQPLDKFDIKVLLQKCLSASVPTCIYCNHARKIAVNGKQLGLHAISEHRYSAIVNSITAEELIPESFVNRIKESLDELDRTYFNLESNLSEEAVTFSHIFECFQCRYSTTVHKELYLHNRKMHTKNLLLCIMCKSNFYSYSELICHLCPGDYVLNHDVQFRCCMCVGDDLPSAFRLMVHLRKRHHVCDVCLEMCNNQYKLSNHVWKHKLHHFCYRCGIAYRNKQDITRHLFWKHGTESVLCKKCLQKKWPHVFHFCIPPAVFTCEECTLNFTKAVYLKVHKRIHANDKPHACTFENCEEKFVSKKLKAKHEHRHLEPPEEEKIEEEKEEEKLEIVEEKPEDSKPKPKVDVYDLPELNLSESSDSEAEPESEAPKVETKSIENEIIETLEERVLEVEQEMVNNVENHAEITENNVDSAPILESIWDDFKIYQAKKEKIDNLFGENEKEPEIEINEPVLTSELALMDHDYILPSQDTNVITEVEPDLSQRVDHDYCTPKETTQAQTQNEERKLEETTPVAKTPRRNSDDDSSSDSDSSSCSCGSNCSCSSSSSSSSSSDSSNSDSSTEEGRRRQQERREKRRTKTKMEKKSEKQQQQQQNLDLLKTQQVDAPILETDLSTTESETDEEFYDKQPLKLAKKLLEEKRNQILAEAGSLPNGGFFENSRNSTPSLPEEAKPKKKSKSKKRKKKKSERREAAALLLQNAASKAAATAATPQQIVAPLTISLHKVMPTVTQTATLTSLLPQTPTLKISSDNDVNLRASKRRRIPNKFYGYSSDEDEEKRHGNTPPPPKWRKLEQPPPPPPPPPITTPLLVPPITIKTTPTVEPIMIRSTAKPGELRVHQRNTAATPRRVPPLQINASLLSRRMDRDSDSESGNDEDDDAEDEEEEEEAEPAAPEPPKTVQLYCYCRCPYDEVSEMIGCDSHDCAIEWFHFECVGIMVPPKGQWFCPDCRKRKQQRRELLQV